ncbi:MAG: preprotein translocase subunit SecY [bacterium]|nr:preprotein translocase subunit SecY [bacterium]
MSSFIKRAKLVLADKALRRRILITFALLALFRIVAAIPLPGVDTARLHDVLTGNSFLGFLNIFSGGGLTTLSVFMLGVGPYITASIMLQLGTAVVPRLKEMYQEEGEIGRRKFAQWGRVLSIPLAVLQAIALLALLNSQGILANLTFFEQSLNVLVAVAGAVLLMWLGEQITDYGIGNGMSLIIFAGIVAGLPTAFSQVYLTYSAVQLPLYLGFTLLAAVIIAGIVYVAEAERPIPVTYAKQVRGGTQSGGIQTYLPIRINQAGVLPIIFAISVLLFPQFIANILAAFPAELAQTISRFLLSIVQNSAVYAVAYFVLVIFFTYFYMAINFEPEKMAENLQKSGAFIPGIRPGHSTAVYLANVSGRLTLAGALFLGVIAVLPLIMQAVTGNATLAIGGTGLLIMVSVVLELVKQLEAQATMREY